MSDQAMGSRSDVEAAEWFTRLRRTAVTTEALREFQAWKQDEANRLAFKRVEAGWKATAALRSDPGVQAATQAVLERRPPRRVYQNWRVGLLPVGAAGALAGIVWVFGLAGPSYATAIGEQRLVVLSDGSRVRLNTDSEIRIQYRPGERGVVLKHGEAFFEVAHDGARPFVVTADGARVRAVGTKFDVRRDAANVSVTLLQGRVEVGRNGAGVQALAPNQQLTVTGQGVSAPRPADAAQASSWTTGRLTFRNMALGDAVAEVNRYSARKIVLAVPDTLRREPVSGVFDVGDTTAFVTALSTFFDLEAGAPSGGVIRLTPRRQAARS